MFKINEIRNSGQHDTFLKELKDLLLKHKVTMIHGRHHIEFYKPEHPKFAQCYCVNGLSVNL